MPAVHPFDEIEISAYPFVASAERAAAIRGNFGRVTAGMSAQDVRGLLGPPDEVRTLFEPRINGPKSIGHTYWYVLQRLVAAGSEDQKQESLVRVSFDLQGQVTEVHASFRP